MYIDVKYGMENRKKWSFSGPNTGNYGPETLQTGAIFT